MKEEFIIYLYCLFCSLFSIFVDLSCQEFYLINSPDSALPSLHPHEAFVQGQVVANSVLRQRKQNFVKVHTIRRLHTAKKIRFMYYKKTKLCCLSPHFHIHVSVSDLYNPTIGPPIFLQQNRQTDCGNINIAHRNMNVGTGAEAAQFHCWEYLCRIFGILSSQCRPSSILGREYFIILQFCLGSPKVFIVSCILCTSVSEVRT
jgi:hypothetical protein